MRFLDKLVLKKDVDKKLMINSITCSILESPSYSDDDDTYYVFSESKVLEPKIKHLIKKSIFRRAARYLERREKNIRSEISLMEKITLK